ncbi:type II toxin-antitoxin system RelE/ParE family toxin [Chryseobacterium koreense]|uniref:type II toxin-antitoxin system RelE/ParE family toxin n=1 Tax=Chryseobacterium koreense TaxID=232216 RepID=UPI0026F061D0|nr:type II toxin-antitoxin system RelE/ParE family toxin [Chryseobacterium koreense]
MAKRKINWTEKANFERKEILAYWIGRNKSKNYSIKLNKLLIDTLSQVAENHTIGRKTEFENVRVRIVRDYLLFYEYDTKQIKVLTIWDGNREGTTLEIK